MATEDAYKDSVEDLARQANTLVVIVWSLDCYARPSKYSGSEVITAAADVAAAKDYGAAKKSVGRLRAAVEQAGGADGEQAQVPPASLVQLMKEVPIINTRLKRNIQGERLTAKAKETAGYRAVLAAIAQGSDGSTEAAKTPEQAAQWHQFLRGVA